jgi:ketosteroid isomerase-like protein
VSRENVELVREGLAAFMAGDLERVFELVHPDVVTFRAPPLPGPQTFHGREGLVEVYQDWTADFAEFEWSSGEPIDAGDRVVVEMFQRGKGRASGVEVEASFWFVYTVSGGRISRQDIYNSGAQAFDAAGLPA